MVFKNRDLSETVYENTKISEFYTYVEFLDNLEDINEEEMANQGP